MDNLNEHAAEVAAELDAENEQMRKEGAFEDVVADSVKSDSIY